MEHEDPQGNALKTLALAVILAAAAAAVAECTGFALFDDAADAEIAAKLEAHAQARKEVAPELLFPIPYDASMSVCVADKCRTTYYVRRENR